MTSSHVLSLMCVDETGVLSGWHWAIPWVCVPNPCVSACCARCLRVNAGGVCGQKARRRPRRTKRNKRKYCRQYEAKRKPSHIGDERVRLQKPLPRLVPPLDRSGPPRRGASPLHRAPSVPGSRIATRRTRNFGPQTSATSTLPNRVEPARRTTNGRGRRAARRRSIERSRVAFSRRTHKT